LLFYPLQKLGFWGGRKTPLRKFLPKSHFIMKPQEIIPFLDYTSLGDEDNEQSIRLFLEKASTKYGSVAAVCIYPKFIDLAKKILQDKNIPVATVVNFPKGNLTLDEVLEQTKEALQAGADEIDLVCRYQDYILQGSSDFSIQLVQKTKQLCGAKKLKVILETGELQTPKLIAKAASDAVLAGADFLKTSTGKTSQGASLEAARSLLKVIQNTQKKVGLKISGGLKSYAQVLEYIKLIEEMKLPELLTPAHFRIGASSLLEVLTQGSLEK
jgi:deoxyribose-phosphate aldolase